MKSVAAILENLERDHARMAQAIADLKALTAPESPGDELVCDWIGSEAAAKIVGVSISRMAGLCREYRFRQHPDWFARKIGGWKISASRLRAWLRKRDAAASAKPKSR